MNIDIRITGSGDPNSVAQNLRDIANLLEGGWYKKDVIDKGEYEGEDSNLFTTITEESWESI